MAVETYRRKPSKVRAIQWTGANLGELMEFGGTSLVTAGVGIAVRTANGPVLVEMGSWVATRVPEGSADFYPIVDSEFQMLYDLDGEG